MPNGFDAAMLPRLHESTSEAAHVVLDLHQGGRKLADAVADTVESLPWKDTTALRRWAENWQGWLEWQRRLGERWRIDKATSRRVIVEVPPPKWEHIRSAVKKRPHGMMSIGAHSVALPFDPPWPGFLSEADAPSEDAVAAATDVGAVRFLYVVADSVLPRLPSRHRWLYYDVTKRA